MRCRSAFCSLALVAAAAPAGAAQQPDSTAAAAGATKLPAVTVTERRAGKDPHRTPLAVTTLRPDAWSARLGLGMQDALSLVPGVLAQSRSGGMDMRIAIRGFGARGAGDRSNAGTTRGIRFLVDGIPETEPDGRTSLDDIDLWTASSVDVIRSNASALWGNASGGLVSVSTVPDFDAPTFLARTLVGSFGYQRNMVQLNGTSGLGRFFATAVTTKYDGWRGNSQNERQLLNAGILTTVGDRTNVGVLLLGSSNLFFIPGPLTQAQFDADPSQPNATYASRQERRYNRQARLGVTLDHRLDDTQSLTSMLYVTPKFLQRSERGTFRDFTRYHAGGNAMYSMDGHWAPEVAHRLSGGLDYAFQDGAILFYSLSPTNGRGTTLRDNKREGASNLGIFVQDEIDVGRWGVTVGVRSDNVSYDYQNYITPRIDASKTFNAIVPKLGVTYRLSERHSVYANIGGGIEVPAGNETDPAGTFGQDTVTAINPLLDAIRSTTVEIGTRHALGPQRLGPLALQSLDYDAAAYLIDVTNDIVPYRGGRFYFTAGKTRRMGVELGVNARTSFGLGVRGAATISDNRYVDYVVDSAHYGRPGFTARYDNNRVVGLPRYLGSLQATWVPPMWSRLTIGAGVLVTGGYPVDDANIVGVPGSDVWNMSVAAPEIATFSGLSLGGVLSVENLLDRRYVGSGYLNPDVVAGVPLFIEPGLRRTVLVSLQLRRVR